MWTMIHEVAVVKQIKSFEKRWKHEVANVLSNLKTLHDALLAGTKLEQLKKLGFVHSEPQGVLAIDQKGHGKGTKPKALRLYVYPDFALKKLHIICLADKSQQSRDIQLVLKYVENLHRRQDETDSRESD